MVTKKNSPTQSSIRNTLIESLRRRYLDGTIDEVLFAGDVDVTRLCEAVRRCDDALTDSASIKQPTIVADQP